MPTRAGVPYFEIGYEVWYHTGNNGTTRIESGTVVAIIEEGVVVQTGTKCRVLTLSDLVSIPND